MLKTDPSRLAFQERDWPSARLHRNQLASVLNPLIRSKARLGHRIGKRKKSVGTCSTMNDDVVNLVQVCYPYPNPDRITTTRLGPQYPDHVREEANARSNH